MYPYLARRQNVAPRRPGRSLREAQLPFAIHSPSLRKGCEIGLRAQGTFVQEAGPGWRPRARFFTTSE